VEIHFSHGGSVGAFLATDLGRSYMRYLNLDLLIMAIVEVLEGSATQPPSC
jgi:hypothetical protein